MTDEQIITTGEAEFIAEIKKRKQRRQAGYYVAKYAVAVILVVFFMFPYLFMVNKSLMSASELLAGDAHFSRAIFRSRITPSSKNSGATSSTPCR